MLLTRDRTEAEDSAAAPALIRCMLARSESLPPVATV